MLRLGEHIGEHWVVDSMLGTGGTGSVFLCHHAQTGVDAAIKVLRPLHPSILKRLLVRAQREAEALEKLDHPGIVGVVDWGTDQERGCFYLGMEAVEGHDLDPAQFRDAAGTANIAQIKEVFRKITDALLHAHEQEVAHRDLKWQNVLMRSDGQPVIVDWGSVYIDEGERLTRFDDSGALGRTDLYAPPEAILNPLGANPYLWDIYSLGVMLFIALTGDIGPYAETVDSHDMVVVKTAQPLDPGPGHDEQLRQLIAASTAPMPLQRPRSLKTFRRLLNATPPPIAHPPTASTDLAPETSLHEGPFLDGRGIEPTTTAATWEPAQERSDPADEVPGSISDLPTLLKNSADPGALPPAAPSRVPTLFVIGGAGAVLGGLALAATVTMFRPPSGPAPAPVVVQPPQVAPLPPPPAIEPEAETPPPVPAAAPSPAPESARPTPAVTSTPQPAPVVETPEPAVAAVDERVPEGPSPEEVARRSRLLKRADGSPDRMVASLAQDPAAVAQLMDDLSARSADEQNTRMTNRVYKRLLMGMHGAPADGARIARAAAARGKLDKLVRLSRGGQAGDFQLPVLQAIASHAPAHVKAPTTARHCRTLVEFVDLIGRPQVVAGAPWIVDACAACVTIEGAPTGKCEDIDAP